MSRDFEVFKKEFEKYRKLLGLTGWDVFYEYKPLEDKFASVSYMADTCEATVSLNSKPSQKALPHNDIKKHAKHEAMHLLLARFDGIAQSRYADRTALEIANEEIAVKLTELIP
jgi:hypothetical protein